jgi:hypothetical protein
LLCRCGRNRKQSEQREAREFAHDATSLPSGSPREDEGLRMKRSGSRNFPLPFV